MGQKDFASAIVFTLEFSVVAGLPQRAGSPVLVFRILRMQVAEAEINTSLKAKRSDAERNGKKPVSMYASFMGRPSRTSCGVRARLYTI